MADMTRMVDVLQISKHTLIQRIRRLPIAGRVVVAAGDAVAPMDILAEAVLPSGVITLEVDRGLGISPEEADACALRKPGDLLREGDLLAQCEGALTRAVRSPVDGILIDFSRGKAVIAADETRITIQAGLPGVVEDIFPEFGVTIRTEGSLVQGEWGNGGICEGPLHVVDSLEVENENVSVTVNSGEILVVPALAHTADFDRVCAQDIAGLVTFWLSPELKLHAQNSDFPVLLVSGFGMGEVDPWAWAFLQEGQGKHAGLNADFSFGPFGNPPELVIPGEGEKPEKALGPQAVLAVGQRVRILTGAAMGQVGKVKRLEPPLLFESGFSFPTATVELAGEVFVQVPQRDLVILGL